MNIAQPKERTNREPLIFSCSFHGVLFFLNLSESLELSLKCNNNNNNPTRRSEIVSVYNLLSLIKMANGVTRWEVCVNPYNICECVVVPLSPLFSLTTSPTTTKITTDLNNVCMTHKLMTISYLSYCLTIGRCDRCISLI